MLLGDHGAAQREAAAAGAIYQLPGLVAGGIGESRAAGAAADRLGRLALGGAMVSEKHCNFLINTGTATAADIETLGETVRRRVREATGIELRWEIRRIGVEAHAIEAPVAEARR